MLPTKIAIFSQNKQRTTFNTHSEPRENVTFLCVGSIPVRNSGFPKRSSCAGSRPDVCVFLYGATKTARSFWPITAARGRVERELLWMWKMDNLSRIFIIHIPTGKALVARWFDWQMPGRGVKRKITSWEEKSAVRYPVRVSSLLGIVLGNCCYV